MKKVSDQDDVKIINVRVLHFRYNDKWELKRYSRKNRKVNCFQPQTKGGMTIVSVTAVWGDTFETVLGSSHCSKLDNFNYREGRILAIYNAIKKFGDRFNLESAISLDEIVFGISTEDEKESVDVT